MLENYAKELRCPKKITPKGLIEMSMVVKKSVTHNNTVLLKCLVPAELLVHNKMLRIPLSEIHNSTS